MRVSTQASRPQPKSPVSAASKISKVVTEFFLPLADGFVPAYTPLTPSPDAEEVLLLEKIWETFPECMRSREEFVTRMGELYDSGRQCPEKRQRCLETGNSTECPQPQRCQKPKSRKRAEQEVHDSERDSDPGGGE